jgi:hypothetical protein
MFGLFFAVQTCDSPRIASNERSWGSPQRIHANVRICRLFLRLDRLGSVVPPGSAQIWPDPLAGRADQAAGRAVAGGKPL